MMLCVSNVIIFPYQKENILRRKWYVLNLVCFGSGTATFDKRGTIESEIEERCQCHTTSARSVQCVQREHAELGGRKCQCREDGVN